MKAILVIDIYDEEIPKEPVTAIRFNDGDYIYCDTKLKPMPEKLDAAQITLALGKYKVEDKLLWQVNGYNRCIDLLLGEEDNGKIRKW